MRYYRGDDEGAAEAAACALEQFPDVLGERSGTLTTAAHRLYARDLALAGQNERALEIYDGGIEAIRESEDTLYRPGVRRFGFEALTYAGETQRASDITPRAPYYCRTLGRGFAELPAYQQLIAELDAERAAR